MPTRYWSALISQGTAERMIIWRSYNLLILNHWLTHTFVELFGSLLYEDKGSDHASKLMIFKNLHYLQKTVYRHYFRVYIYPYHLNTTIMSSQMLKNINFRDCE